jgi:2-iminobutanoate/2-iminopropanoate deaminase
VGNVLFSSGLEGVDQETGKMGKDVNEQAELAFKNVKTLLEMAGGSTADIVHIHVLMGNPSDREAVNKPWVAMFPEEDTRPARRVVKYDPPPGLFLQLEIIAFIK